jgi:RHS repeat-associated protein
VTYDGSNSYLYDAEGRICAVKNSAGAMTGYIYDAAGTRVARGSLGTFSCNFSSNGYATTTSWVLDLAGEQVTEYSVSSGWVHTNAFEGGKLLATYRDTRTYFAFNDWLGTKRVELAANLSCGTAFTSLPYGNGLNPAVLPGFSACADATEHHFTGKERDAESGNDYFEARYYSSAMGRFLSPDWSAKEEPVPYAKMDDPQSLNLYAYVRNNPLTRVDADGHSTDTYVPDLDKHGGAHIDRYNKAGQNVGRYNLDGTPMKHKGKTASPIPNSDKKKFEDAAEKAQKKLQERSGNQQYQDLVNNPPPVPTPPLPDGLKPDPTHNPFPDPGPCAGPCGGPLTLPYPGTTPNVPNLGGVPIEGPILEPVIAAPPPTVVLGPGEKIIVIQPGCGAGYKGIC